MPEPADEPAAPDDPARPVATSDEPSRRDRLAPVVLGIATAVFAVIAVVLLLLYQSARKDHDTLQDELRVRTTASRFAEAFVALDTNGPLADQDAVVAQLGTGPIISQHTEAMTSLRAAYKAFGAISARGQSRSTYISQIDDSATEATVIVDLTLTVIDSQKSVPSESYLEVHLVKVGGTWKVNDVVDIRGRLGSQPTTPTTAGGTTTTAPGPPSTDAASG